MTLQAKAGLVLGVLAGVVMGTAVGVGSRVARQLARENERRLEWPRVPVVIAKRALSVGRVLTMDDLDQKTIPERLATADVLKPQDASYVVNQPLYAPLGEGQPMEWSFVEVGDEAKREPAARRACEEAVRRRLGPARDERIEDIRARLTGGAR